MNTLKGRFLDTEAAVNTFRVETHSPESGLTSFADILSSPALAAVFSSAPCSVCSACDLPTVGPTYRDSETGGQFCLLCLELSGEALEDSPEEFEDAAIVAIAEQVLAARRASGCIA